MSPENKKKVTCPICDAEHTAGEACPNCEWDAVAEERRAKGEVERERLRELAKGPKKKSSGFWS